jgi:uncharacterized protein
MLSFDIRSLDARAATVDGQLAPDDDVWQEGDTRSDGPIDVTGRLSSAGAGRYYWSGRIGGTLEVACRRCLEPVRVELEEDAHALFVEEGDEEADDPDVYLIPARSHSVDLRPAVREQWLLVVPAFAVCREDCKGLCPTCGADLNAGPCNCDPAVTDTRWDALRAARPDNRS